MKQCLKYTKISAVLFSIANPSTTSDAAVVTGGCNESSHLALNLDGY